MLINVQHYPKNNVNLCIKNKLVAERMDAMEEVLILSNSYVQCCIYSNYDSLSFTVHRDSDYFRYRESYVIFFINTSITLLAYFTIFKRKNWKNLNSLFQAWICSDLKYEKVYGMFSQILNLERKVAVYKLLHKFCKFVLVSASRY